jgi:Na+/melibiose symporter-like transporter
MHGSLIDSHRRLSLTSNGQSSLSLNEQIPIDDQANIAKRIINVNYQHVPLTSNETKNVSVKINECIEKHEDHNSNHDDDDDNDDDDDEKEVTTMSVTHSADFFRWTHGHRRVMLTFCTICLFAFMTGVEYAVILPTAFDYVKTMTDVNIYVGLILSSYSISGSIAGLIMGKLADMTGKVKILIIVSNIFEIAGNILYFVTNSIIIVLLGRFIAGVGMGAVPPVCIHRVIARGRQQ